MSAGINLTRCPQPMPSTCYTAHSYGSSGISSAAVRFAAFSGAAPAAACRSL